MNQKNTDELEKILVSTHINEISEYIVSNKDSILQTETPLSDYIKEIIHKNGLKQQDVFLEADIPERYGYKLLSGEKRTRQRDIIIRLCYASKMTLDEVQKALKYYRMPELYAKIPRDALLMIAFNERPGNILDVNSFLKKNNMDALRSSGIQE